MAPNTTTAGTKKSKRLFGAFRKKKAKKTSNAASIAMDNKSAESKKQFLVEDSNSSTTEDVNLLELDSDVEYSLDLVVLLMHPVSHRFELLQLEFDEASKAKISDLLAQIPLSVTENCLKDQLYDGILNQDSADPGSPLILKSTKLIDAFGRKLSKPDTPADNAQPSIKMVLVARPQGLSNEEALKMAKPIFTNKDISSMLALSGFDVKHWKKKKFSSKSVSIAPQVETIETTPPKEQETPVPSSATSLSLLGFVFVAIVSMLLHSVMITPTPTNYVLKPGSYSSKCGLFGFVPMKATIQEAAKEFLDMELFTCQDEFLKVNSDGTATLYDSEEAIMILKGAVCSADDETCANGLVMKSDKTLEMGGQPVKQVLVKSTHKNKQLSWPFAEDAIKLRYKVAHSLN